MYCPIIYWSLCTTLFVWIFTSIPHTFLYYILFLLILNSPVLAAAPDSITYYTCFSLSTVYCLFPSITHKSSIEIRILHSFFLLRWYYLIYYSFSHRLVLCSVYIKLSFLYFTIMFFLFICTPPVLAAAPDSTGISIVYTYPSFPLFFTSHLHFPSITTILLDSLSFL